MIKQLDEEKQKAASDESRLKKVERDILKLEKAIDENQRTSLRQSEENNTLLAAIRDSGALVRQPRVA